MNLHVVLETGWSALLPLAAQTALAVTLTALILCKLRAAAWRRALWQTCFLCLAGLLVFSVFDLKERFLASDWGEVRSVTENSASEIVSVPTAPMPEMERRSPDRREVVDEAQLAGLETGAPILSDAEALPPQSEIANRKSQMGQSLLTSAPTGLELAKDASASPTPLWWFWLGWAGGAVALLARLVIARLALAGFCWRYRLNFDDELGERVQCLAVRLGMKRRIRVFGRDALPRVRNQCTGKADDDCPENEGRAAARPYQDAAAPLRTPIAFGLFLPSIALPGDFTKRFSRAEQDAMLAHELAHLAARDPLWYLLADVLCALLWWHPLVWWARAQLHTASELSADEASLLVEGGPQSLAECLVRLAGDLTRPAALESIGVEGDGFRSRLGRRVERLLRLADNPAAATAPRPSGWVKVLGPVVLLALLLTGTGWIAPDALRQPSHWQSHFHSAWDGLYAALPETAEQTAQANADNSPKQPASPIPTSESPVPTETVKPAPPNDFITRIWRIDAIATEAFRKQSGLAADADFKRIANAIRKSLEDAGVMPEANATNARPSSIYMNHSGGLLMAKGNEAGIRALGVALGKMAGMSGPLLDAQEETEKQSEDRFASVAQGMSRQIDALELERKQAEDALKEKLKSLPHEHPEVKRLEAEIDGLRRKLAPMKGVFKSLKEGQLRAQAPLPSAVQSFPTSAATPESPEDKRKRIIALLDEGKRLFEAKQFEGAVMKFREAWKLDPSDEVVVDHLAKAREAIIARDARDRTIKIFDAQVGLQKAKEMAQEAENQRLAQSHSTDPKDYGPANSFAASTKARYALLKKMEKIVLPKVGPYAKLPLSVVVKSLMEDCKKADPEGKGVTMLINSFLEDAPTITSPAATPGAVVPKPRLAVGDVNITIDSELSDLPLIYALDVIVKSADQRIKYIVEDYAIVFTANLPTGPQLFTRTFKVNPSMLVQGLRSVVQLPAGVPGVAIAPQQVNQANASQAFQQSLTRAGVNQNTNDPAAASVVFDPNSGIITARATLADLEKVQLLLVTLAEPPPPPAADPNSPAEVQKREQARRRVLEVEQAWKTSDDAKKTAVATTSTKSRQAILRKLEEIRLKEVHFDGLPLSEVVKFLNEESKRLDPEKKGVAMLVNSYLEQPDRYPGSRILGRDGLPLDPPPAPVAQRVDVPNVIITISAPLADLTLAQTLDVVVKFADRPIKFIVEDYAVVFTVSPPTGPQLYTRTYKVDPSVFIQGLQSVIQRPSGTPGVAIAPQQVNQANASQAFQQFLTRAGVNQNTNDPTAARVAFNPNSGLITARATVTDLEKVQSFLVTLVESPPSPATGKVDSQAEQKFVKPTQVLIEAKLLEIPDSVARETGLLWFTANPVTASVADAKAASTTISQPAPDTNRVLSVNAIATMSTIMTEAQAGAFVKGMMQKDGVDVLSAPRVTTLSGRQAQVSITDMQTVVVGKADGSPLAAGVELSADGKTLVRKLTTGPLLDLTPTVQADGSAIELKWQCTLNEFLGYETAKGRQTEPSPKARERMVQSTTLVPNGQTLMIGGGVVEPTVAAGNPPNRGKVAKEKRHLIILLTPWVVDEKGNRVNPKSTKE